MLEINNIILDITNIMLSLTNTEKEAKNER